VERLISIKLVLFSHARTVVFEDFPAMFSDHKILGLPILSQTIVLISS
jgi:hypothetical protein